MKEKSVQRIGKINLKNIQRLIRLPVGKIGIYDVEPEVIEWANLHAQFFIKRYMETPNYQTAKLEDKRTGLISQKIFDVICQQLAVPKDHNDPIVDWRREKSYDFCIPNLGTVEVKGFKHYCKKVLVKVNEWHGNDFLVVFRLMDEKPSIVHMEGWLTGQQVEALPISRKGQTWDDGTCYTPHSDAYITDFTALEPATKFFAMLAQKSLKLNASTL